MTASRDEARMRAAVLAIAALTALRVVGLVLSPVELHGDEAQYWSWSRHFDWGYFSKPPLIAWVIAATTAVFGNAEWAVRIATPFAHAAAAGFLMAYANRRWGPRAAAWAGLLYLSMPAIWLSSAIVSTDAFLLMLWAGALWALDRHVERPSAPRAVLLGGFIGLGFLAKYAMIYFVIGLAALAIFDRPTRAALMRAPSLAAAAAAAVFIAPNIAWNASHKFETLSHTAANASWGAENFQLNELSKFVGDQFGVFGPVAFALLLVGAVAIMRAGRDVRGPRLPLLAFTAPALLIVGAQAFISRANANWAVASYLAGTVLIVAVALEGPALELALFGRRLSLRGGERWLAASFGLHLMLGLAFWVFVLSPGLADRAGFANAFKRTRGWTETTRLVEDAYAAGENGAPYAAVLVDNRLLFHDLEYYSREAPLPLRMWRRYGEPRSHAESVAPMTPLEGPVLVVSERFEDQAKIRADFAETAPGRVVEIPLGGGKIRRLQLFAARGFAPLPRGEAYEGRWEEDG